MEEMGEEFVNLNSQLVRLRPDNATAHYNLACSLALVRRKADALRALQRAIELGYDDYQWMAEDADLDGLKKSPEFHALLAKLKSSADS